MSIQWPGITHAVGKVCLSCGETVAHSHYNWAKNEFWKAFGQALNG